MNTQLIFARSNLIMWMLHHDTKSRKWLKKKQGRINNETDWWFQTWLNKQKKVKHRTNTK